MRSLKNYKGGRSWSVHLMIIDYLFNTKIFSSGRGCTHKCPQNLDRVKSLS
jgi:hypothetical protein